MVATTLVARGCALHAGRIGRILCVLLLLSPLTARGEDVVQVEEDWELVLSEPDATLEAPQITCVIAPGSDDEGTLAAFELNHRTQPDYQKGGMQLQVWSFDSLLTAKNGPKLGLLAAANETVRWTQRMSVNGASLTFEVTNGGSDTWGSFGGQGYLKHSLSSSREHLNNYDPELSVKNTGIGFGANRVSKLVLKRVRLYSAGGLLSEVETNKVVHESE